MASSLNFLTTLSLKAENSEATQAVAKLQEEGKKQTDEFEKTLAEIKASIKNLDIETKKDDPPKGEEKEEKTIRSAYKRKTE